MVCKLSQTVSETLFLPRARCLSESVECKGGAAVAEDGSSRNHTLPYAVAGSYMLDYLDAVGYECSVPEAVLQF